MKSLLSEVIHEESIREREKRQIVFDKRERNATASVSQHDSCRKRLILIKVLEIKN